MFARSSKGFLEGLQSAGFPVASVPGNLLSQLVTFYRLLILRRFSREAGFLIISAVGM